MNKTKFKYNFRNKYKIKKNLKQKNPLILTNLHITASLKNTIISLTTYNGNLLKQWSTKSLKKTRFKKNTPYNVQLIVYKINKYLQLKKIKKLKVYLHGTGLGRYNVLKNLKQKKFKVKYLLDKTTKPFNGCRLKKQKRR
ncbi:ribosomal protein S11 (mitochondrion) [Phytophthora citrophthora]|uniref:Ribosomal protein S11 n=1 Tax=Phytophthora citrophthora TaxID=4793 RepID=A0AAD9L9R1_9STRA|nr:ribosomal protein S11 [Phytophthora botryosa]YP_010507771.1 ribosomal protein S11 [Phytophthora citrophthora]YP_010990709.1 ribosomal protein S11 [Phytophthora meadii]KAK1928433.1 ribosomal protein S11 [Phytophthora citrophthora]UXG55837.1 ribosomal protein S11 [Phytophthora botryosa]UXG55875.1 ribosomal protein S11 [Phytophthora citrophthora]WOX01664.1 ribosomal protein S11 [Phytophthora meadii]